MMFLLHSSLETDRPGDFTADRPHVDSQVYTRIVYWKSTLEYTDCVRHLAFGTKPRTENSLVAVGRN